jgi:hypothetical protein
MLYLNCNFVHHYNSLYICAYVKCILQVSVFWPSSVILHSRNHLIYGDSLEVQLLVMFIDWRFLFLPQHVLILKGHHQVDYIRSF